jgi:ankyrin repeat protein
MPEKILVYWKWGQYMFNNRKQSYQTTGAEEVTLQQGLTAPSLYVDGDYRKIEQFLLSGAYVNTRSGSGKTPLMVAVRNNCAPEIVKLLLKSGADPNLRDSKGRTALMYAAGHSYMTSINLLLQAGSKIDEEEEHTGLTSLMFSLIKQREIQVVTGLIDAGADVNHRDIIGETPLMMAARYATGSLVVEMLVKSGADPTAVNNAGSSVLSYAWENTAHPEVASYLVRLDK